MEVGAGEDVDGAKREQEEQEQEEGGEVVDATGVTSMLLRETAHRQKVLQTRRKVVKQPQKVRDAAHKRPAAPSVNFLNERGSVSG